MRDRIFYSICFGFITGIFLKSFFLINIYLVLLLSFISVGIFLFHFFISKNNWGVIFSIFILTICLGIFRFNYADVSAPQFFEQKVGQKVSFTGLITDEPSINENNQKLIVSISREGQSFTETNILLTADLSEDLKYGDKINFRGILKKPENFVTDSGKDFDYINYLRKDGIFYVMNFPEIKIVSSGNGNSVKSFLFSIKNKFLEKINFAIKNPENILMGGLILGEKSSFDENLRKAFIDTGTIHIVALSGYNVTIVAEWIMKLFSFLPQHLGIGVGIFSILLFILMTGGSSTAIRAGVMATLALIARATGRNYDVARALILAGVFMIFLNPLVLVYDVSFQLSFIATIAVIFLAPRIEKYFMWITPRFQLRDIITVTCAVYVFVLPFILYKMGNLSIVALPANILILPFIPFTMLLGFMTGFVGLIYYMFAVPLGYISYFFLHYELLVINLFSHLPFASLIIPNFPFWLTLLIYLYFLYRLFGGVLNKFFREPF